MNKEEEFKFEYGEILVEDFSKTPASTTIYDKCIRCGIADYYKGASTDLVSEVQIIYRDADNKIQLLKIVRSSAVHIVVKKIGNMLLEL